MNTPNFTQTGVSEALVTGTCVEISHLPDFPGFPRILEWLFAVANSKNKTGIQSQGRCHSQSILNRTDSNSRNFESKVVPLLSLFSVVDSVAPSGDGLGWSIV